LAFDALGSGRQVGVGDVLAFEDELQLVVTRARGGGVAANEFEFAERCERPDLEEVRAEFVCE
jgi:hypothetical protein